MFFSRAAGHKYIDRGDPSTYDFTIGDFTLNEQYHDLSLATIVPVNVVKVHLGLNIKAASFGKSIGFRKKGKSNDMTKRIISTQRDNYNYRQYFEVACGADRIIEYLGEAGTFTTVSLVVLGWDIK